VVAQVGCLLAFVVIASLWAYSEALNLLSK
jgi:hypothetical protein